MHVLVYFPCLNFHYVIQPSGGIAVLFAKNCARYHIQSYNIIILIYSILVTKTCNFPTNDSTAKDQLMVARSVYNLFCYEDFHVPAKLV